MALEIFEQPQTIELVLRHATYLPLGLGRAPPDLPGS